MEKPCAPCFEEDCPWPPRNDGLLKSAVEHKCFLAGVCICCASGRRLKKFRDGLLACIKLQCPIHSTTRELLVNSFVVVRLRAKLSCSDDVADWFGDVDPESSENTADHIVFWHVAFMSLAPFYPVFQDMSCKALEAGMCLDDTEEVFVEAPIHILQISYVFLLVFLFSVRSFHMCPCVFVPHVYNIS